MSSKMKMAKKEAKETSQIQTQELQIDFQAIEKKWQQEWEKAKIFQVQEDKKKKKYYVLEMYPYPSASFLHVGHVRNYTIGDVFSRFKRMQGYNVLYPMGYDSFGLPAETAAKKEGIHPKIYAENSIKKIMEYQKALGNSYDWSRVIASHEPEYYKWNQWFFLKLFEKGLAYRKKAPVNFCETCQSVLANEESAQGKCWRCGSKVSQKETEQWFFKITDYIERLLDGLDKIQWSEQLKTLQRNWIGKSQGINIDFIVDGKNKKEKWQIFTTRPDTIYGVTFMVISALHPRLLELVTEEQKPEVQAFLKKIRTANEKQLELLDKEGVFTGSYAINPLTKEHVPVWAGNFVLADYGSGMVMAVPSHDQRDFEFAIKYNIPIKQVIKPKISKSVVLGQSVENGFKEELKKNSIQFGTQLSKNNREHFGIILKDEQIDKYIDIIKKYLKKNWWVEIIGSKNISICNKEVIENFLEKDKEIFEQYKKLEPLVRKFKNVLEMLDNNFFYKGFVCYIEQGILINSDKFSGLESKKAIEEISKFLESKKFGKKTTNYKIRDWLISRQRYWGTPIPIIYCDKCGIVPVPEKNLPVLLPEKVDFKGSGNPLASNKEFLNVKCPKCGKIGRRETDTLGGFMDSSWYFLRYCDNKNSSRPFDSKKVEYWMPVDQYIGGIEHAVGHLIYARFFVKFLKDIGMLKFDEPFTKLFNQGIVYKDGNKMSKSHGNVVFQTEISEKYGIDTARLFLMFVSSPDKQMEWSNEGIEGSFRIINKLIRLKEKISKETSPLQENKINSTIKKVSENIENFEYPKAIISIVECIEIFSESISKENYEILLKLLAPFCPHITEELWHDLGNKTFLSKESWPETDESKINEHLEKQEQEVEKTIQDINNILKMLEDKEKQMKGKKNKEDKEKENKEKPKKVYIYVLPNELLSYQFSKNKMQKSTSLPLEVFAVNDKNKYDPQGKSSKAKPGKPAIFIE
jgi:leucyl-tRNA synthetase